MRLTYSAYDRGETSKLKLADLEGIKDNRWKQQADIEQLKDPV